eukprot:275632_1
MSRLDSINAYVDQAKSSSDLISLITHIPLAAVQTFIKHHVQHSRLADKNDLIEFKQRNRIILDPQYEFKIDFQSGTRWVVHPNTHPLNGEELAINSECKGP